MSKSYSCQSSKVGIPPKPTPPAGSEIKIAACFHERIMWLRCTVTFHLVSCEENKAAYMAVPHLWEVFERRLYTFLEKPRADCYAINCRFIFQLCWALTIHISFNLLESKEAKYSFKIYASPRDINKTRNLPEGISICKTPRYHASVKQKP